MTTADKFFPTEKATGAPRGAPVAFSVSGDPHFADKPNDSRAVEKFVVFFVNELCCGIAARSVVEVSRPLDVAVLPHSPKWLAGIANLRGEIIPVLDIGKMLNEKPVKFSSAAKFVVLRGKNLDSPVALPVDRLKEIITVEKTELKSAKLESGSFIYAAVAYQTTFLHLIDAEEMLSSIVPN